MMLPNSAHACAGVVPGTTVRGWRIATAISLDYKGEHVKSIRKRSLVAVAAVTAVFIGGAVVSATNSDTAKALAYYSIPAVRVLDTRDPAIPAVGAKGTLDFTIPGLPDDVKAVDINITVTNGTAGSFLVVYPVAESFPATSNINWIAKATVANKANVNIGADHKLRLYNEAGTVDVIIDVTGYYATSPSNGGPKGDPGIQGPPGPAGVTTPVGAHWGIIDRNTIGSPVGALRTGPFEGAVVPPMGDGSLGFSVANFPGAAEKIAFGNEVDFVGQKAVDISKIGFSVFSTGENKALNADNMPNITFEVDPTGPASSTGPNYSSLVFNVAGAALPTNVFNTINAASDTAGVWWFSNGATGTATGCNQTTTCTFSQLKTAIASAYPDMSIISLAIAKGRDYAWNGAIDALVYNGTVYNFEPFGVYATAIS